jgi:hypothetical protein
MTMRKKTQAETVEELRTIMKNRRSRIEGLVKLLKNGASKSDIDWISKEIKEHEKWISDTEKVIANFYAPAA